MDVRARSAGARGHPAAIRRWPGVSRDRRDAKGSPGDHPVESVSSEAETGGPIRDKEVIEMPHGFSEAAWIEWSEGTLDAPARIRLQEHVRTCVECDRIQAEMRLWRERLAEEGAKLRSALALPEPEISRMLAESLKRVRQPACLPVEGLAFLRALLAPVLGAGAIRAAIEQSVHHAAPDGISSRLWTV